MARRAEGSFADHLIVVINEDQAADRADWLRVLTADGESDTDAHAADIVRELRERCEGDDAGRP